MFKYNLEDVVFAIHKNKIHKGKIIARKNVENLNINFRQFDGDDGISYAILFEKSYIGIYQEQHVFESKELCMEYISE